MAASSWFLVVGIAVASMGCAAETDGSDDDTPQDFESEEQAISNASISGTKLCVRVNSDATMFRNADGAETVTTTSKFGALVTTAKNDPRYVLVQPRPGRVGSRVWADPDLNGLRSDGDIPALAKRCRISVNAAKRAAAKVVGNKYTRRGWIEVGTLSGNLAKNLGSNASTGPAFDGSDRDGAGNVKQGKIRTVRAQCLPQGEYVGSNPKDPAGFYTYGTCVDWKSDGKVVSCRAWGKEMYLSYGTPEIDGGGLSLGYVTAGQQVHQLATRVHEQKGDHCQTDDPGGKVECNGDAPARDRDRRIFWSEIYARVGARTLKGWVPEDCLQ
jgi:hypothetical protein